jgi:hypothetical protein
MSVDTNVLEELAVYVLRAGGGGTSYHTTASIHGVTNQKMTL